MLLLGNAINISQLDILTSNFSSNEIIYVLSERLYLILKSTTSFRLILLYWVNNAFYTPLEEPVQIETSILLQPEYLDIYCKRNRCSSYLLKKSIGYVFDIEDLS